MPKGKRINIQKPVSPQENAYLIRPWGCNHYPTYSEIEAYIPITGDYEIIAGIYDTKGVDAEVVVGLIARAVNNYQKSQEMIMEMAYTIELCLQCREGLSWEAEHDAEAVLKKVKNER